MIIMNKIKAIAVFQRNIKVGAQVNGEVIFTETDKGIKIEVSLSNLKPGKHGFHVHETGNILEKCVQCRGHFNPYNKNHGGTKDKERHVGDLGNIVADSNGNAKTVFYDKLIKLRGTKCNIIGRSIVVHEDEDNLGKPDDEESLKSGRAGKRIGCAVIGYMDVYYF